MIPSMFKVTLIWLELRGALIYAPKRLPPIGNESFSKVAGRIKGGHK